MRLLSNSRAYDAGIVRSAANYNMLRAALLSSEAALAFKHEENAALSTAHDNLAAAQADIARRRAAHRSQAQ